MMVLTLVPEAPWLRPAKVTMSIIRKVETMWSGARFSEIVRKIFTPLRLFCAVLCASGALLSAYCLLAPFKSLSACSVSSRVALWWPSARFKIGVFDLKKIGYGKTYAQNDVHTLHMTTWTRTFLYTLGRVLKIDQKNSRPMLGIGEKTHLV